MLRKLHMASSWVCHSMLCLGVWALRAHSGSWENMTSVEPPVLVSLTVCKSSLLPWQPVALGTTVWKYSAVSFDLKCVSLNLVYSYLELLSTNHISHLGLQDSTVTYGHIRMSWVGPRKKWTAFCHVSYLYVCLVVVWVEAWFNALILISTATFLNIWAPFLLEILKILGFSADVLCAWGKNMRHCYMLQKSFKQSAGCLPTRGLNYQS